MKVGDKGFITGGINPATGDCFWKAEILEVVGTTRIYIRLQDGTEGWTQPENFTPMYMKDAPESTFKNYLNDEVTI